MKKLFVLILSVVAFTACQSSADGGSMSLFGDGAKRNHSASSGGSISASQDQEDFIEFLKERAGYGELFRSIMESLDATCEIFDDYIMGDEINLTMSFATINEQLNFGASDDVY